MLTIAKLFGKSPFKYLQAHMEKVAACINELPSLFEAMEEKDLEKIKKIEEKISKYEHAADLAKNDIRNHLPKSLFLQIDRATLLDILSMQDSIADKAQNIAILATMRTLDNFEVFKEDFIIFYQKNIETFILLQRIIKEFDALLESSFGGMEAEKVKTMIEELAFMEHEVDYLQHTLMKKLFAKGDDMPFTLFHLWNLTIKEVAALSNMSEKLANRIRMILEVK